MEKFSTEISDGHTWTYPPTGIGSYPKWRLRVRRDDGAAPLRRLRHPADHAELGLAEVEAIAVEGNVAVAERRGRRVGYVRVERAIAIDPIDGAAPCDKVHARPLRRDLGGDPGHGGRDRGERKLRRRSDGDRTASAGRSRRVTTSPFMRQSESFSTQKMSPPTTSMPRSAPGAWPSTGHVIDSTPSNASSRDPSAASAASEGGDTPPPPPVDEESCSAEKPSNGTSTLQLAESPATRRTS